MTRIGNLSSEATIRTFLVCCALALCNVASAQSAVLRRPALHWARGDDALECVEPRSLAERVEELVGPVLVRASEAEFSVEASVARPSRNLLRVQVRVLNVAGVKLGERSFEYKGTSCAHLTPAIAFVIAMMIDPDVGAHGLPPPLLALLGVEHPEDELRRELEAAPPPPLPAPPPPAPPPPPPPPAPVVAVVSPALPVARRQAALLARGAWRETARAALGVEARYANVVLRPWLAAGGYVRFNRQLGEHGLPSARTLALTTFDVGVLGCGGHTAASRVRLLGCAGIEVSTAYAVGTGFVPNSHQVIVHPGMVAQLTARMRVTQQLGVMLAVNARIALSPREVHYRSADLEWIPVYRMPTFSGGLALGPSYEF